MPRKFAIQFADHLQQQSWWDPRARYILALSGGRDSMALAHLMRQQPADLILAHVNFKLRGEASDTDEAFVREHAQAWHLPVEVCAFDTRAYAREHKLSEEMAARALRYRWFEELKIKYKAKGVLTAHHAHDLAETVLLNMTRGMGVYGLDGIVSGAQELFRPLLFAKQTDIEAFVKSEQIAFRQDASNASVQIPRNRVRHRVLPELEQINAKAVEHIGQSALRVQQMAELYREYLAHLKQTYALDEHRLDLDRLKKRNHPAHLLYEFLSELGINSEQAGAMLAAKSGSKFSTATHEMWINRGVLEVFEKPKAEEDAMPICLTEPACVRFAFGGKQHQICIEPYVLTSPEQLSADPQCVYVEQAALRFPLYLRTWEKGDEFQPFGMKNTKKISDFFVDEKYSPVQKKEQLLLCDAESILWVVGKRLSEQLRVTHLDAPVYRILME